MCDPQKELENLGNQLSGGLADLEHDISGGLADFEHDRNVLLADFDSSLGVSATITALAKDPLPTLAVIGLTWLGVPPYLSAAMITAARGGSMEDIVKSGAMAYISGKVGTATGTAFAGSDFATNTLSPELSQTLKTIVTSASGDAAVAALQGRPLNDVLAAGMNSAVTSYVTQGLTKQLGLTDPKLLSTKISSSAISSATNAILNGKDVGKAITASVTQTALSEGIKTGVDTIVKNSETIQGLITSFNDAKKSAEDYFTKTLNPQYDKVKTAEETAKTSRAAVQSAASDYKTKYDGYIGAKAYADSYKQAGSYKMVQNMRGGYTQQFVPDPGSKTKAQVDATVNAMIPGVNAANAALKSVMDKASTATEAYNAALTNYNPLVSVYEGLANVAKSAFGTLETKTTEQNTLIEKVATDTTAYEAETERQAGVVANALGADALAEAKKLAIENPIAEAYKTALGKDATPEEISSYAEQVASKGIDSVVSSINNSPEAVTYRETTDAKEAYSDITGTQPTAEQIADFRTSNDVVAAAQNSAINGLDLPSDYKFPDQANKVFFGAAFADARKRLGPNATFEWTNPDTGKTGKFTTQNQAEAIKPFDASSMSRSGLGAGAKAALDAGKTTFTWADGKVYKVPDAYAFMLGSNESSAETHRLLSGAVVPAKSTDYANDYFGNEFATDPMTGAIVSGDGWASGTSGKTFDAINTAAGGAMVKALDVGSGVVKGGSNIVGQVGTLAGLTGLVDMDNLAIRTSKQVNDAVDKMRSTDFKNNQQLMNEAIKKAGNAGMFEQAVETAKQFGVNPTQLAEFVVQNGMSLLVGSGAMTVARGLGAGMTIAEVASLGVNALTQGASVAQETYEQAIKDGVSPEDALTRARVAGSVGGVISAVANKYIPGALSNETRLAQAAVVKESLTKALKGELTSEAVEEVGGKVSSNIVNGKAWNADLGTTAVQALLGSGLVTSLVHVSTGGSDPIASTPETGLEGVTAQQFEATTNLLTQSGQTPTVEQITDAVKTTQEEAAQFYQEAFGAPPTQEQLQAFIGKPEAEVEQVISVDQTALSKENETAYRIEAANQTDLAEAARLAGDGAGQAAAENASAAAKAKADQIKALATVHPEMVADKTPSEITAEKILAMTSDSGAVKDLRYDLDKDGKITAKDAVLGSSGTEVRTDIRADGTIAYATPKEIQDAIAGIQFPAGITPADVTQAITNYMTANPGITLQQVATAITTGTTGLATDAGVKTSISDALKGVATTADVNAAIARIQFPAGLTKTDVAAEIKAAMEASPGLSATDVASAISTYMTANPAITAADLKTAVTDATKNLATQSDVETAIKNIQFPAGITPADVSLAISNYMKANPGLTLQQVAEAITTGTSGLATDAGVKTSISDALKGVATTADVNAAIAGIKFPVGLTKTDVAAEIKKAMKANPGLSPADVTKSITDYMTANPGLTAADVSTAIAAATKGMVTSTDLAQTEKDILAEVALNEKAGMTRDAALQKAINTVATAQKTDVATLTKSISGLGTTLGNEIAGVQADLAQTEKDILAQVAVNEKAGMTRDAALQKAINTVATTQKTDTASLLTKLGKTEESLKTQFSTQFTNLDTKLSTAIADAKAAGLKGDAALKSAIDKVAADQQTTAEEILTQMGKSTAELKTQFASDISGLTTEMQTKYDALSQAQKNAVDAQVQQGKDLTLAITESAAGLQTQISGLSAEMQTQYGALTQAQKDAVDAQVQQGKDLTKAITDTASGLQTQITGLSADMQSQYSTLTQAQKDAVASQVQQGKDLAKAITDTASGLQSQITGLGADAQAKYAALTAAQKLEVDARVQQGVDLTSAINAAQTKTETQIGTLSADLQTKYDALTKADQAIVDTQIQQGIDTKTAIDNATKTTTEQITKVQTDLTKNITDVQTQFNTRVDELVGQGKSYQDATQAALGELNSGVLGLQSSVTDIKAAQAAEIARVAAEKEAAAKAGRAKTAQQGRQALLAAGAARIKQGVAPAAEETARPWAQLGLTSTGGDTKFESVLGSFIKDAEAGFYDPKQPNEQQQQAAPAKKELDMQNPQGDTNYFNYGNEYDINEVLAENPGTQMLYSKAGGLATPLFANGGNSGKQNYAGGGLNVISHEGKPRIDFRTGNAVTGPGDGQSDDIPAMLADGEFVFPADVVAALGNGSTKAGSDKLYDMMHSIRAYHRSAKPKDLPPAAKKSPLDYLKKRA